MDLAEAAREAEKAKRELADKQWRQRRDTQKEGHRKWSYSVKDRVQKKLRKKACRTFERHFGKEAVLITTDCVATDTLPANLVISVLDFKLLFVLYRDERNNYRLSCWCPSCQVLFDEKVWLLGNGRDNFLADVGRAYNSFDVQNHLKSHVQ